MITKRAMNQERNRTDYLTTKNIKNWELISKKSRLIKTMNVSTTKEHVHSSFLLVYGKLNCLLFIPKLSRSTHNSWKSTHLSHLMFEFWVSLKIDTFKIKYTSILWQRYGYSRCITHEFFRAAAFRWNPNFLHQFCRFSQIFPRSSQDFPIFSHISHDFPSELHPFGSLFVAAAPIPWHRWHDLRGGRRVRRGGRAQVLQPRGGQAISLRPWGENHHRYCTDVMYVYIYVYDYMYI